MSHNPTNPTNPHTGALMKAPGDMSPQEQLQFALARKTKGNSHFLKHEYHTATDYFKQGLKFLEPLPFDIHAPESEGSDSVVAGHVSRGLREELLRLRVALGNNLTLSLDKAGEVSMALEACIGH